jgi:hypothetical protein
VLIEEEKQRLYDEAQKQKAVDAEEWVPDGYDISYQGTQVIEGFAQKFLKSGFTF